MRVRFKSFIVFTLCSIIAICLCSQSQASQDLQGRKCTSLGQKRIIGKITFKCTNKGKGLVWENRASSKSIKESKKVFSPWSTEINQQILITESKQQFKKWVMGNNGVASDPNLEIDPRLEDLDFSWISKTLGLAIKSFGSDSPSTYTAIIAKDCRWVRSISSAPCKDAEGNQYFSDSVSKGFFVFRAVVDQNKLRPSDFQTVAHEYFHSVQAKLSNGADWPTRAPVWFIEGGAFFVGLSFSDLSGISTYRMGRSDELLQRGYQSRKYLPLKKYTYANFDPPSNYEHPYGIGCVATEYIVASVGIEKYLDIYRGLGEGKDFQTAFEIAAGIPLSDFYLRFEQIRDKVGMPHGK